MITQKIQSLKNQTLPSSKDLGDNIDLKKHPKTYKGKVRDIIIHDDHLEMHHSDRLSAFDRAICDVPYKGIILCELTKFWFEHMESKGIPTHLISQPGPRTLKVKNCTPFKIEVIIRGYLAGSMQRAYLKGDREICGLTIPEGLNKFQKLPEPLITPTTKAAVYEHDENISEENLLKEGLATPEEWKTIKDMALKVYEYGRIHCEEKGWILVDTKYEFGKTSDGKIVIIDEVHTPDSSRFWQKETYEQRLKEDKEPVMFDKEFIRKELLAKGFDGHGDVPEIETSLIWELANRYVGITNELVGHSI